MAHASPLTELRRTLGAASRASVVADLRYAMRRLRRRPGFTFVCVATLALGIGASTAIFSAVNPILFEPLPYPHANRIVMISDIAADGSPQDVAFGTYREIVQRSRSLGDAAVTDRWQPAITGTAAPERLQGARVSATWFRTLGVRPELGRDFSTADDRPQAPRVVILGEGLARRRFGGGRGMIGRTVMLDGEQFLVIGIMPADFEDVLTPRCDIWTPLRAEPNAPFEAREWGHHYRMIARLGPGITPDRAGRELLAIARTPVSAFPRPPWANLQPGGLLVHRLQDDVTRSVRPSLLALLGAVLLVLAIACVNVTNLLLARAAQRRGEFAMRSALGAGRMHLTRQLLAESLALAMLGVLPGLAVAELGTRALVALGPEGLPRAAAIRVDGAALAFAIGLTTIVGLLVGIAPALAASRGNLRDSLQGQSSRSVGGRRQARSVLVVAEVALALVLLVGAGLLLRTLGRLFAEPPGFDSSHVLTMQVVESGRRFPSDSARLRAFTNMLDEVRRLPEVTAAGFTSQLPLSGDADAYGVEFESVPRPDPNDYGNAFRYAVTPGYFAAMRIPLLRGRLLDAHDRPALEGGRGTSGASPIGEPMLINASLAKRLFGDRDPIGERLRAGPEVHGGQGWDVVVGVVGDVKQLSLALGGADAFYVASSQWRWVDDVQSLVVRTSGDPRTLVPAVRRAVWSVDRDAPIVRVTTMDALVAASEAQRRFALRVFEAFALAALVLAAIGLYGVLSGIVAERTREIGVRSALGASREDILGLVVRQGMTLAAVGIGLGIVGAALATRALTTLLYGVALLDPATYAGVVVVLLAVAALACWAPAWRAARVDPLIALRAD